MNTEMENGTQMTLEECMPGIFRKPTVGASDFHARTYQLPENNLDFKETVQACFSELCTLSDNSKKKINPLTFSLRTLKICLVLMEDGISPRCSLKWTRGGYDAEWQVLNSKDFGVPQNRERCFIIGHLRGRSTAKVFPVEGTNRENSVSLNLFGCLNGRNSQRDRVYSSEGLAPTISTKPGGNKEPKVPIIFDTSRIGQDGEPMFTLTSQDRHGVAVEPLGVLRNVRSDYGKEIRKDYEDGNIEISRHKFIESEVRDDGVVNTLSTVQKDNQLAVKVAEATKQGYAECRVGLDSVNLSVPGSATRRGRVGHSVANTLDTSCNQGIFVKVSDELTVYAVWYEKYQCYIAIRKMTPRECFRLQGWSDDYFEKAKFVNSDSQLYKQAGNGVTVSVIKAIAERLRSE